VYKMWYTVAQNSSDSFPLIFRTVTADQMLSIKGETGLSYDFLIYS